MAAARRANDESGAGSASAVDVVRTVQSGVCVRRADVASAIEVLVRATSDSYENEGVGYAERRGRGTSPWDEYLTEALLQCVRTRIAAGRLPVDLKGRWRLLDVGAGPGRDLVRLSHETDILPFALENSPLFVRLLADVAAKLGLPPSAVVAADMRDLSALDDASFQCVRSHATLHHLPVVGEGLGADVAVAETRRVLDTGGVFSVLAKAGTGVEMIDTKEGMGQRFYQLFSSSLMTELLERNRFTVVRIEDRVSHRPAGDVDWMFCLAAAV